MAVDIRVWRKLIDDEVRGIADEAFQRKVWFGGGVDWIDSPNEQFCRFFDNASVPEFLARADNELSERQELELSKLSNMMEALSNDTPSSIKPENLIDDPRWKEIRKQARIAYDLLSCGT